MIGAFAGSRRVHPVRLRATEFDRDKGAGAMTVIEFGGGYVADRFNQCLGKAEEVFDRLPKNIAQEIQVYVPPTDQGSGSKQEHWSTTTAFAWDVNDWFYIGWYEDPSRQGGAKIFFKQRKREPIRADIRLATDSVLTRFKRQWAHLGGRNYITGHRELTPGSYENPVYQLYPTAARHMWHLDMLEWSLDDILNQTVPRFWPAAAA